MKMMKKALTLSLALLACALLPATAVNTRAQSSASSPEAVVRGFYAWYLGRLNKDDWTPFKRRAEALRYLTPEFYRSAPRIISHEGVDIFICAQDWMQTWERNFRVAPANMRGAKANVITTLPVTAKWGRDIRIKLRLRRVAGGAWRIEATDCLLDF